MKYHQALAEMKDTLHEFEGYIIVSEKIMEAGGEKNCGESDEDEDEDDLEVEYSSDELLIARRATQLISTVSMSLKVFLQRMPLHADDIDCIDLVSSSVRYLRESVVDVGSELYPPIACDDLQRKSLILFSALNSFVSSLQKETMHISQDSSTGSFDLQSILDFISIHEPWDLLGGL